MAKTIITAALTGAVTPAGYNIPETPEQIAQTAYECWKLGAAVVHIHTRHEDGKGAMNTKAFAEIVRLIRSHEDCDVVINCTSSGASVEHPATDEERYLHHMTVPGIEMGSYDAGTFNWMPAAVFMNSPQFLEKLGDAYMEKGIKPEIEIFDAGMLGITDYFVKKGHLPTPCHYQFCLGVLGGMPATVENLLYMKNHIPAGSTWSAFGVGAGHLPILYATLALGGHIRVGMEDNVVFGKDENGKKIMATNQMLVQRAVEAVKTFGNQPATPAEARKILGIPPRWTWPMSAPSWACKRTDTIRGCQAAPYAIGGTMTTFNEVRQAALRRGVKTVAVAAAADAPVLEAVRDAARGGYARAILVGDGNDIDRIAGRIGLKVDGKWVQVVHQPDVKEAALTAARLVHSGKADILMKGLRQR